MSHWVQILSKRLFTEYVSQTSCHESLLPFHFLLLKVYSVIPFSSSSLHDMIAHVRFVYSMNESTAFWIQIDFQSFVDGFVNGEI